MIRHPNTSDWLRFYDLAAAEGWRVPHFERQLFAGPWSRFARVLDVDGRFSGLVTVVAHEQSGWIGNLIVPRHLRGRGYGGELFQAAVDVLTECGMSKLWLTASAQGQPLYERAGFVTVDRVERWVRARSHPVDSAAGTSRTAVDSLLDFDRRAWGEDRKNFMDQLLLHSQIFSCDDSLALLQQGPDLQIIGPWYSDSGCPRANRTLLQSLLATADTDTEIVADLLTSSPLRQLVAAAGFEKSGEVALMVRGEPHAANLAMMVSLASLGSLG